MASLILKPGRDRSLLRHHPWVFSGAVARTVGAPQPGETVDLLAHDGAFLARGAYSPRSQIVARAWSFDPAEQIDAAFLRRRLASALAARHELGQQEEPAGWRLVNAESDGLPGLVVDRYGDYLVCQFLAAGVESRRAEIVAELAGLGPWRGIWERSEADVRRKEELEPRSGLLAGEEPPELIEIREGVVRYLVDVRRGHKTGFYLDQRDNRARVARLAPGREVLNAFAYTGGFGIAALANGAQRVVEVESSPEALALARRNLELNGLDVDRVEPVQGDVFHVLRRFRDAARAFDLVVLDPPKFAESRSQVERAARGYKDINLLAIKLLRPGGLLVTFSCSGQIDAALFQSIVAGAASDSGRWVQVLDRLGPSADHPTALVFPEGDYLKGLLCRVA